MAKTSILRILRGTLGTAAAWAVTWAAAGFAFAPLRRFVVPVENPTMPTTIASLMLSAVDLAMYGTISGVVFATLVASRGRFRLPHLSLRRMAFWGASSALILPVGGLLIEFEMVVAIPGYVLERLITYGALGALCAAGTLALARRGRDAGSVTAGEFRAPVTRERDMQGNQRLFLLAGSR